MTTNTQRLAGPPYTACAGADTYKVAYSICDLGAWRISNLTLQKILFIMHLLYMGKNNGEPLVNDTFEAWAYGPVIPRLYHEAKYFGAEPVEDIIFKKEHKVNFKGMGFIREKEKILSIEPYHLVSITHRNDGAWAKHYKPGRKGIMIPNESIMEEYRKREIG